MNVLSYRGPEAAGGVSRALSRICEQYFDNTFVWWYATGNCLANRQSMRPCFKQFCYVPQEIVDGHYRYCNEVLWPILHDMPCYATYNESDRAHYQQFNFSFGLNVLHSEHLRTSPYCLVNDYQLALIPELLVTRPGVQVSVFWHIPWPETVLEEHVPLLAQIATGLLGARTLGFHTNSYAANFLRFVDQHLTHFAVEYRENRVIRAHSETAGALDLAADRCNAFTDVVVRPLGIDVGYWRHAVETGSRSPAGISLQTIAETPYVLSVDRADYTKGVVERLEAIDRFFALNPSQRGKLSFLQVCQPTRIGLPAFDHYWQECQARAAEIQQRWSDNSWSPIVWVTQPIPQAVLSRFYRGAGTAMLVNPLRDGLNLTAKEFAACLDTNPGALVLSPGAGVWAELGRYAVPVNPASAPDMVAGILEALALPLSERRDRAARMQAQLSSNTLSAWWQSFVPRECYRLPVPAAGRPLEATLVS